MATDAENLATAKSALLAALAANGHKPNYSIDGQSVTWGELWDRIAKIDAALAAIQGPFEVATESYTL